MMANQEQLAAAKRLEKSTSRYLSKIFESALKQNLPPELAVGLSIKAIDSTLVSMLRVATRQPANKTRPGDVARVRWLLAARASAQAGSIALMAGPTISSSSVAKLLGIRVSAVERARANGRLLGYRLPAEDVYRFPVFQFDGASVVPWLPEVVAFFGSGFSSLHFLTVERKSLNGGSFLRCILESPSQRAKRTGVTQMLAAARNLAA